MQEAIPHSRRVTPSIPAGHPKFKWTPGADVQATWRRFGWVPPSAGRPQFVEPTRVPAHLYSIRVA